MAGNTDVVRLPGGNLDIVGSGLGRSERVSAVVLGAGGAARAAVYALIDRGFEVCIVNRTLAIAVELAETLNADAWAYSWSEKPDLLKTSALLVNTTCLGMAGQPSLEIDLGELDCGALVCDIVYVPLESDLLRQARKRGLRTVDGLGMLLQQAAPGFGRWFGVEAACHATRSAPSSKPMSVEHDRTAADSAVITDLERQLLTRTLTSLESAFDLLDDDFVEFGRSGAVYTRAETVAALIAGHGAARWAADLADLASRFLSVDLALVI